MKLRDRMLPHWIPTAELRTKPGVSANIYLLWVYLWFVCDDFGVFEANAALLRAVLYARALDRVSEKEVRTALQVLHVATGVRLYTEKGVGYGKVIGFEQPNLRLKKREYPAESLNSEPELFAISDPPPAVEFPEPAPAPPPERKKEERKNPTPAAGAADERDDFSDSVQADLGHHTRAQVEAELFATLAALEGSPLDKLTDAGRREIKTALNAIRKVNGSLTSADLERAYAAWKKLFDSATFTARGCAKHWAKLVGSPVAKKVASVVEEEPLGWRDWINENTPDCDYARGHVKEGTPWHDLDGFYRRYLIEQLKRRSAA